MFSRHQRRFTFSSFPSSVVQLHRSHYVICGKRQRSENIWRCNRWIGRGIQYLGWLPLWEQHCRACDVHDNTGQYRRQPADQVQHQATPYVVFTLPPERHPMPQRAFWRTFSLNEKRTFRRLLLMWTSVSNKASCVLRLPSFFPLSTSGRCRSSCPRISRLERLQYPMTRV